MSLNDRLRKSTNALERFNQRVIPRLQLLAATLAIVGGLLLLVLVIVRAVKATA